MRQLGPPYETYLAHALEVLGEVEMRSEHLREAGAAFKEAVTIRARTSSDLWELARARERLGEALARSHAQGAAELLERSTADLESQLGASHPETIRAKAALALARA
jgi:hypothetical protein